jgi:hypothetical protein
MSDPATLSTEHIDRFCAACGYNLRGVTSDRCPECGASFDPNQPAESQIPWSHRRTIGRRKAFWRTVKLVCFKPTVFAAEINRPVSLLDALAFRGAVAIHAFIPLAGLAAYLYIAGFDPRTFTMLKFDAVGSIAEWLGLPILIASIWLFLIFALGVGSYFFHPGSIPIKQQNRALALSYYACAPWTFFAVTPLCAAAWFAIVNCFDLDHRGNETFIFSLAGVMVGVPLLIQSALNWSVPPRLLKKCTHCSNLRVATMVVLLPLLWALMLLLTVGLLNAAYWALALIALSLT